LARITLDWDHIPLVDSALGAPEHPFAADLNLTGRRSLLHLLDTTVSRGGRERLREWLFDPAPNIDPIHVRQALVRELTPLSMFRDRLVLNSTLAAGHTAKPWDGKGVIRWLEQHENPGIKPWLIGLFGLSALNVVLVVCHILEWTPALWPFSLTLYAWIYLLRRRSYSSLFDEAQELDETLRRFRAVLHYLETYPLDHHLRLARLCAPFREERPSVQLKRITRIAMAAGSQKSEVLWLVLNTVMPWDLYFAHRLERYKADLRVVLPRWLDTWYDLEALGALANFAALHPSYHFPEIVPGTEPVFEARQMGHPLLPALAKVRNDFTVGKMGEVVIITGSNMSGKSTFLRTLGINLSLAQAGGPVDADAMHSVPMRLFTCLQVADSVNDGISYFYAEVRRLRALLDALVAPVSLPLFFLVDEIFRGTNNRERLHGSRSLVRALTGGNGIGAISTHDLELVHLDETIEGLRNVHFREEISDGRMKFDYRLRPGPCPTTNALKIMEMEGLPVEYLPDDLRSASREE